MLRKLWPYHLLYVAIIAAVALLWGKIHKHSFYAHYFRTTQASGERNSQLLPDTQWVAYADVATAPAAFVALLPAEMPACTVPADAAAPALTFPTLVVRAAAHPFLAGAPANGPPV